MSIGNSFKTWNLEQVLLLTVLSRGNGSVCGSPISWQRSVFLSGRQDNEALIIRRLSFQMLVDCLDYFFFLLLVEIFYSFEKWDGNICNYKPDGKIW